MKTSTKKTKAAQPKITNALRMRRLLRLKRIVENVQPNNFDLSQWSNSNRIDENPCDTVACAGGHACFDPVFRRAGLRFRKLKNNGYIIPVYKGVPDAFHAMATFFGLDRGDAYDLFKNVPLNESGRRAPRAEQKRIFLERLAYVITTYGGATGHIIGLRAQDLMR